MPNQSVFAEEWRDCLRAHYTQIIRNEDRNTEKSLHGVMLEASFSENEIKQIYVQATAHVDDVGADFVPDMDVLNAEPGSFSIASVAVPETFAEVTGETPEDVASEMAVDAEIPVEVVKDLVDEDNVVADMPQESDAEAEDAADDETPDDDPDVTQLSMF